MLGHPQSGTRATGQRNVGAHTTARARAGPRPTARREGLSAATLVRDAVRSVSRASHVSPQRHSLARWLTSRATPRVTPGIQPPTCSSSTGGLPNPWIVWAKAWRCHRRVGREARRDVTPAEQRYRRWPGRLRFRRTSSVAHWCVWSPDLGTATVAAAVPRVIPSIGPFDAGAGGVVDRERSRGGRPDETRAPLDSPRSAR